MTQNDTLAEAAYWEACKGRFDRIVRLRNWAHDIHERFPGGGRGGWIGALLPLGEIRVCSATPHQPH